MPMRCRSTAVGAFLPRALQLKKKAVHLMHYMGMWPIMKAIRLAIGCATLAQFEWRQTSDHCGRHRALLSSFDRGARRYSPHSCQYSRPIGGLLSQGGLQQMLEDLDAETRAKIDVQNPMRVARAWEVLQGTGQSIVSWQAQTPPPLLPLEACHALHLTSPVDWLNDRLKRRFEIMIAEGALEEARRNLELGTPDGNPHRPLAPLN